MKQVVPGFYEVSLGMVNVFLVQSSDGLVLIDAGNPGSDLAIMEAVKELGKGPADIKHILVTHCHGDHTGGLAEIKRLTGAPVYMHPLDAEMVRAGKSRRPWAPAPGLITRIVFRLFVQSAPAEMEAVEVEYEIHDGEEIAGGLSVLHTPGHTAGHLAFLGSHNGKGVLFAGDVASNMMSLGLSVVYEELSEGERTLARLSGLDFDVACFGHGRAITEGAAARFRRKWGA